jgi:hypothetical protein
MAMASSSSARRGAAGRLQPPQNAGGSRRILSLSQITGNAPGGAFKRSQSVRVPGGGALRKSSWAATTAMTKGYGDLRRGGSARSADNKENAGPGAVPLLKESDEYEHGGDSGDDGSSGDEFEDASAYSGGYGTPRAGELVSAGTGRDDDEELASGAETPRRSSMGTTVITETETDLGTGTMTGSEYSGDEDDDGRSVWTESAVGTESSSVVGGGEVVLHNG